jgi:hypothetical protein
MSTHAAQSGLGRVGHQRSLRHVNRRMSLMLVAAVLILVGAIAGKEIANNHTGNSPVTIESRSVNAGNVTIDAGSPSLRTLNIKAGPGNLTVNLSAPWRHDVAATTDGGIGNTTLRLPATIGVQVAVQGMGQVTAPDFARQGDSYVNAAFGNTKVAVHVSLTAGIGNVVLTTGA